MTEQQTQQQIRLALSRGPVRLWRNNVGTGWAGATTTVTTANLGQLRASLRPGDVIIRNGRPLHAGLCIGSSDLIGLRSMTVSPAMVGRQVAVFAAVEVKSATGRLKPEQSAFIDQVWQMGGLSGVARSVNDAAGILDNL